ncbi:MAG: O-antigen ligase family protein, partial [Deltaproteobacteria bacterium]
AALARVPGAALAQTAHWAQLSYYVVSRALTLVPERTVRWTLSAWALAATFAGLLAFSQHWTGFDLVASLQLRSPIRVDAPRVPGRWAGIGTFNSRLTLAHVLALVLAFEVGRWLVEAPAPRRLWLGSLAGWLLGIWSSFARAAWLALALVLAAAAPLALSRFRPSRRTILALAALAAIGTLSWAGSPGARSWGAAALRPSENADRLFLWARAAEMALDRPVLGAGFGRYARLLGPYYDRFDPSFFMRTWSHDMFLSLLVECGPLGLFAYGWIFVAAGSVGLAAWLRRGEPGRSEAIGLCLGGALAALAFGAIGTFHDVLYDGEVAYNLAFALGLAALGANRLRGGVVFSGDST